MNYLNRCLLLGWYRSITIIDEKVSCLVIVINDEDDNLPIPVIIESKVAKKLLNTCEDESLIGIKGKINSDEYGLIIKTEKISFLSHKERAKSWNAPLKVDINKKELRVVYNTPPKGGVFIMAKKGQLPCNKLHGLYQVLEAHLMSKLILLF